MKRENKQNVNRKQYHDAYNCFIAFIEIPAYLDTRSWAVDTFGVAIVEKLNIVTFEPEIQCVISLYTCLERKGIYIRNLKSKTNVTPKVPPWAK